MESNPELKAVAARWEAIEERYRREREHRGRQAIALRLALLLLGLALLRYTVTALDARRLPEEVSGVVAVAVVIVVELILERRARRAQRRAESERAVLWSEHHHELQRLRRALAKQASHASRT